MERTSTNSSSSGLRVGKLLPKALTSKRRRRKEKAAKGSGASSQEEDGRSASASSSQRRLQREATLESDDTNSNMADDDEIDNRSFGSLDSGADADHGNHTERSPLERPASNLAPTRPATLSAHPSLIGYLTTSSPVVQAEHLDVQSHFQPLGSAAASGGNSDKPSNSNWPSEAGPQSHILLPPAPAKIINRKGRASPRNIDTEAPQTPAKDDNPAPAIVNTPPTPTDRIEHPFGAAPGAKSSGAGAGTQRSADGSPIKLNMNIHRRSKSGSAAIGPSKLSHITAAPLTPTDEKGGETTPSATGFFSSVISAAQNAASSISNTIPSTGLNIGGNKGRTTVAKSQGSASGSQVALDVDTDTENEPEPRIEDTMSRKESAIRTLGSGDLSLSQLGITEQPVASPASARFPDVVDTRTRSESAPADPHAHNNEALPEEKSSRPHSLLEAASGERTPPQTELAEPKASVQRSSSIRSAMKPHKKRASSVMTGGTGTTIAAAITSAHGAALPTSGGFGAPKLTGFAIASKKRNRDFHNFFKSVPDDDYLIEDYSCALQREILAHGRLYVSEGHLCFSSNILGWTTTLVMSFDEIVSVEKRSTALVFKNGLMISTLHAKHIFASFTSRDATYDLIVNIWKLGHPTLRSTLNGVQLEGTGGDKTEKVVSEQETVEVEPPDLSGSEDQSDDDHEEFYDEGEHDELPETQSTDMTAVEPDPEKTAPRKASGMTVVNGVPGDTNKEAPHSPAGPVDFPGPVSHPPTGCGDSSTHYDKILADEVLPAPMGKIYNLVFGPGSVSWMNKWLTTDQKCTDIQMEDKKGLTGDNRTRTFTYIKPLNGSIGPKQTKCVVTETIDQIDLEKAVNISVSTQTPDVPYGNLFTTKTKYCLSWAENDSTRVQINCTVEWSGKCWLKGTIEKSVNEGQGQYCKELFASLKSAVSARARSSNANNVVKGKKKLKRSKTLHSVSDAESGKSGKSNSSKQNWGPLEPLRVILEPCLDILQPVLTGNVMYGLLVGLLVAMWFGYGTPPGKSSLSFGPDMGYYSPSRAAAYEAMWRREDSELWDWLEERVGMDRLNLDQSSTRKRSIEHRTVEDKLREEQMNEREVHEAIRITEEKLRVLREVVEKEKGNSK